MPSTSARSDHLTIGNVQVELRRSARRRTLGLQVKNGVATAHAPVSMSLERIQGFLQSKAAWLEKHVQAQQTQTDAGLLPGDTFSFLGENLTLQTDPARRVPRREGQVLWLPAQNWQAHLKAWSRHAAQPTYTRLVQDYAALLGAAHKLRSVKVSDTRSRWGSCTAAGDIRLHWALTRAPLDVLRYVALHEAAHLLEMNHSPRYWAHVARVMPDHERHRAWLRREGRGLLALAEGPGMDIS